MKGVIFVELLAMAEDAFGEAVVDRVIEAARLPSGAAYTRTGNYPCEELLTLVRAFAALDGSSEDALQRSFGHWTMRSFERHYPRFFSGHAGSLDMLSGIEDDIHAEVRKLYPDADLPSFETVRHGPDALDMTYRSPRPLAAFCHGLIEACVEHFGERARIERRDPGVENRTEARFSIRTAPPE